MNLSSKTLRLVCVVVGVGGAILIAGATPGTQTVHWPASLAGPGAGLVAAGLAGLVGLRGVQTWGEKQAEHVATATRENRARVYEQVLAHVIGSFVGGAAGDREATIRAMAASWASQDTLQALSDWLRFASRYSGEPVPKHYAYELIYRVAAATRKDIDPGSPGPSKDEVLKMIFNDYEPAKHNPPEKGLAGIRVLQTGTVAGP